MAGGWRSSVPTFTLGPISLHRALIKYIIFSIFLLETL